MPSFENVCGVQEYIVNKNKNTIKILKNGLYIIATPIGNLNDLSPRVISTLNEVDFIICENPKHSVKLLNKLGIKKKLISLHDYNEESVINKISKYQNNSKIGLISDAGSPLISDPGYKLVKDFINKNILITSIPGPSSLITSLQVSGLPINKFTFYGFVPKQKTRKRSFLEEIAESKFTSVFFVAGRHLENLVSDIVELLNVREIAICKELTKLNEIIFRGTTIDIYNQIREKNFNFKGEFVIIVSASSKKNIRKLNTLVQKHIVKLLKKYSLTETVQIVHNLTKISKKEIYKMAIEIHNE